MEFIIRGTIMGARMRAMLWMLGMLVLLSASSGSLEMLERYIYLRAPRDIDFTHLPGFRVRTRTGCRLSGEG